MNRRLVGASRLQIVVTDERHVSLFGVMLRRDGGACGDCERECECGAAFHGTASG
jgi:hypothetical protein